MSNRERIAVLGLGAMGSRMGARLLDFGYDVTVYNRSEGPAGPLVAKGARKAADARDAVQGCAVVISCVRDDEATRSLWLDSELGALACVPARSVIVESSTLTPSCARELASAAKAREVGFLDAPVVGSRPQAEAGQLAYLVGGDAGDLARVRSVLERLGGAVHHVGETGAGALLKLIANSLFGIQVAALAELLSMAGKAGLDPKAAFETLAALPMMSPAAKGAGALIAAGNHAPLFPIELVAKDFGYAQATAQSAGAQVPVIAVVRALFEQALAAGQGGLNISGIATLFAPAEPAPKRGGLK